MVQPSHWRHHRRSARGKRIYGLADGASVDWGARGTAFQTRWRNTSRDHYFGRFSGAGLVDHSSHHSLVCCFSWAWPRGSDYSSRSCRACHCAGGDSRGVPSSRSANLLRGSKALDEISRLGALADGVFSCALPPVIEGEACEDYQEAYGAADRAVDPDVHGEGERAGYENAGDPGIAPAAVGAGEIGFGAAHAEERDYGEAVEDPAGEDEKIGEFLECSA